jgi:hypothetical protein
MLKMIYILFLFCFLSAQESIGNNVLTIIGTTNVHGEVDPCG